MTDTMMIDLHPEAKRVLDFWFVEHGPKQWWAGGGAFDVAVRLNFADTLRAAERCETADWRRHPRGRVAEIMVLDQFSRQLYRRSGRAFANDALALALAQEAVAMGIKDLVSEDEYKFVLMPYMHSESLLIHDEAMVLYSVLDADTFDFERRHRDVIERFGRYPKRNAALARVSSAAELAYINDSDSMF
ncbi:MAG: DUF924 family protein [Ahrensia sp.]